VRGRGEPCGSDDWRESLALCLLCAVTSPTTGGKELKNHNHPNPAVAHTDPGGKTGVVDEGKYIRGGQIDQGQQGLQTTSSASTKKPIYSNIFTYIKIKERNNISRFFISA
jgi:hypothetical protein